MQRPLPSIVERHRDGAQPAQPKLPSTVAVLPSGNCASSIGVQVLLR